MKEDVEVEAGFEGEVAIKEEGPPRGAAVRVACMGSQSVFVF